MNTKFEINRQVILTLCVLLVAMWLPLTTFAQDFSKTGDLTQRTNTWAANCSHCQTKHHSHDPADCHHSHDALIFLPGSGDWASDEIVGFAETDPTDQRSRDVVEILLTSNHQMQQVSVGFAETDPAHQEAVESVTVLSASNSPTPQESVGFSETDPAINLNPSIGELHSQHLVDCLGGNAKGQVFDQYLFYGDPMAGTSHSKHGE